MIATADGVRSVPGTDARVGSPAAWFRVVDRKHGQVALKTADGKFITVSGLGESAELSLGQSATEEASAFMWTEMPGHDLLLLSMASHRYLRLATDGSLHADAPGAAANRMNGASFSWRKAP